MDLELRGRRFLVTGASRGIGRAIAKSLGREGAVVAIVARGADALETSAREVEAAGGKPHAIVADVATSEGADRAVREAVAAMGGLDGLVNNVGGSLGARGFDQVDEEAWRRVLDTNLMSAVYTSRHAVEVLKRDGGVIVHIGSICGREYCTSAPYVAAKAALTGLTKEMGINLAKHRIRVNAVSPGSILFPGGSWDRRQKDNPALIAKMVADELPWGRFGTPEEVADVVTFLCSSKASWVTGSTVVVDGGQGRAF
ncbi:MAG: SDR family oxidoreductase [Polyangiaceae bacterium]|nr:SDR family oxidoreductase [Polyangiaceae bacterium]